MRSYRSVRHGTLKRITELCSRFTAYHFWRLSPWAVVAFLAFCFAIQPR
jgi:hypothetical protein